MGLLRGGLARAVLDIDRSILAGAARIVTVTEPLRRLLIDKGLPDRLVSVISNGVDPAEYYPADDPPPVPELAHAGGEFIVGYLGNFGTGQGLEVLIDAAAHLDGTFPGIRFVLAGDGTERTAIDAQVRRRRLSNLAVLPALPKRNTRAFYNSCDACVVPLRPLPIFAHAMPTKLFEIMACGRPVVASAAGSVADALRGTGAGLSVAPGDSHALAEAICHLTRLAPCARADMGARGIKFVHEHFQRGVLADRFLDVLRAAATE
jgi:hypothetical protein